MNTLETLAGWAWSTSLGALPLGLMVVLLWRAFPARGRWWLAALVFVRLALPMVPETDWYSWRTALLPAATASIVTAPVSNPSTDVSTALPLLPILWSLGAGGVAGWVLLSHWRLRKNLRAHALPASAEMERRAHWAAARMGLSRPPPVLTLPGASTMAICGWLRPVLLLPDDLQSRFNDAQIRGMLLHEMRHVRRHDVLWTWLALGLCALHWFNPLAWLALRRLHADRELACDDAALNALEPSERRHYGEALLLCLQGPALPTAPTLAPFFRRFPELQQRLQNIMHPTSPNLPLRILVAVLFPVIGTFSFTTARAQPPREGEAAAVKPAEATTGDSPKPKAEAAPAKPRDGDPAKLADPVGERPRDGERKREGQRDGDQPKSGPRDGEKRKSAERDGERPKKGPRDGERPREGARDGEAKKAASRDGDQPRTGPRDGDAPRTGPRDGDAPKTGPREDGTVKAGPRDGERAETKAAKPEER